MDGDNFVNIIVPKPFKELFQPTKPWENLFYYGGRGGGKSTTVAISLLVDGSKRQQRGVCCREFQNSIEDSVHALFADLIEKYHFVNWVVQERRIFNRKTDSSIVFKGMHGSPQTIKSFEGADWAWVEEAQSVSADSVDVLIPTIRKAGSRIIWTMNRLTENDPAWERVAKNPDDLTYVCKVNSYDIETLLSDKTKHDREKMRRDNPELFEHIWLGEPLTAKTGSVFGKQMAQAREDGRISTVPYDGSTGVYTAWDLGVSDSTVIWFFQNIAGYINFIDYYEGSGEDLGHYISVLKSKPYNYATHFLPHDAMHRELQNNKTRVEFFADNGITNVEVLRPTKFKLDQNDIDLVARPKLSLCRFDEKKCQRGIDCLRAYHFSYDDKNKLLRDKPEHDWSSHASSAFIYALIAETEYVLPTMSQTVRSYVPRMFRK